MAQYGVSQNPAQKDRWICIYPAYINSKKTLPEGRKIPKSKAVDNPTANEIRDICNAAGLQVALEAGKCYPRDQNRDPLYRGRVRVQLKNENSTPVKEEFPSRKALLLYVSEMIPKLKTRQQKQGGGGESASAGGQDKGKKKKNKKR
ncbi:signal recognition particle 19 kDa protein-like [Acanthaster planci]|uniref:Signal recognition particle 19 kDa protein-like n=1 Tax=Acanthaster planci TaxID=133434 RepID=A0A8B7Y1Q7_ACAPL|nr:signal recognition particle 19 kDa protein-like [Acanthaster planci]